MKFILRKIFLLALILIQYTLNPSPLFSQSFTVMSYNVRYDNSWDTLNSWKLRRQPVVEQILNSNAQIVGVQEALVNQMDDLVRNLKTFKYVGVGRDDGKKAGEFSAILFDTTVFKLLQHETFWLSETPAIPSKGWDAALERICTSAKLLHRESGEIFWVFNTHFDHMGQNARNESASLILNEIKRLNPTDLPCLLMGDFNSKPTEKPYAILSAELTDALTIANQSNGIEQGTFNGFSADFTPERIDYLWVKKFKVVSYSLLVNRMDNGRFPSDHFPVVGELNFIQSTE